MSLAIFVTPVYSLSVTSLPSPLNLAIQYLLLQGLSLALGQDAEVAGLTCLDLITIQLDHWKMH